MWLNNVFHYFLGVSIFRLEMTKIMCLKELSINYDTDYDVIIEI